MSPRAGAGTTTDLVIVACAISAGIHVALVPEHLEEGRAAGIAFAAAAVLLGALAIELTLRPRPAAHAVGGAVFAGLLVAYALALATGIPLVHPDREPADGLALATKAIEAVGLLAALDALRLPGGRPARPIPLPLTLLIATFSMLVALSVAGGMHMSHGT
jgi:hypothetical protein